MRERTVQNYRAELPQEREANAVNEPARARKERESNAFENEVGRKLGRSWAVRLLLSKRKALFCRAFLSSGGRI